MKNFIKILREMRTFLLLWITQSFSSFGSAMTSYALVIWSYTQKGSALMTALLMVSTYTPYVILSIFAGALSDRWNKKATMLVCDSVAAVSTVVMFILLKNGLLEIWHLYLINAVNGLMNTVQSPASEVAVSRILPKQHYQRVGGLRYFSNALNSIFVPVIATAVIGLFGLTAVVAIDLATFSAAFLVLALAIKIPEPDRNAESGNAESSSENQAEKTSLLDSVKGGISFLKNERGLLCMIMFLSSINLIASIYNAALPAMVLSRNCGGEKALGMVNSVIGISMLIGSVLASAVPAPKNRVRTIFVCLFISMGTENIMLALGRSPLVWCVGGFLGYILIPLMSANLDAIMRLRVPDEIQGRVYSVRNTFQFFTIPAGYFLGGFLVDKVFEPFLARFAAGTFLERIFGNTKGSGAALLFFVIAFAGVAVCIIFRTSRSIRALEKEELERK
ncbi:MFS transporter [uncultured Treponema sp.]|uniref:MFS transporter n=1 Tax=uncultured Treponema sp. TaxID=162155 RepID=UPI000E921CBE|nr:MFS transporter [uncultured Treponema sp.]HAZ97316.1 MFS transporter [Treponema sp.]